MKIFSLKIFRKSLFNKRGSFYILFLVLFSLFQQELLGNDLISWDYFEDRVLDHPNIYYKKDFFYTLPIIQKKLDKEYTSQEITLDPAPSKQLLLLPSFILKKRIETSSYNELIGSEISTILNLQKYIAPSFLVFIDAQPITVQKRLPINVGWSLLHPPYISFQHSLKDYFLSHISAYILGLADLSGANIGIHKEYGYPIFFDLEDAFIVDNTFSVRALELPCGLHYKISLFYTSCLLGGDLFYKKINIELHRILKNYQHLLANNYLPPLKDYLNRTSLLSDLQKQALLERVDKVIELPFAIGTSFNSVVHHLFNLSPKMDDYINQISSILGWKSGFGGTLFWLSTVHQYWITHPDNYEKINSILEELYQDCLNQGSIREGAS